MMQLPSALLSPGSKKIKKFLIFQQMELNGSNIKKFQETETPKKIPYISGNGNHTKAFYLLGNTTFQTRLEKISYTSVNRNPKKISYIFLKESCSYAPEETPKKFLMFQETELSYIFPEELPKLQKTKFIILFQKSF